MGVLLDHWLAFWLVHLILSTFNLIWRPSRRFPLRALSACLAGAGVYCLWRSTWLTGTSLAAGLLLETALMRRLEKSWSPGSRFLFASLVMTNAALLCKGGWLLLQNPSTFSWALTLVFLACLFLLLVIDLCSTYEILDGFSIPETAGDACSELKRWPEVSIHIPVCNEPVSVVTNTLLSIQRLDYPSFEVIVVYNNTANPDLWKPVECLCRQLGFRFFYVPNLEGFKAGALNLALLKTSKEAELIAVFDSDYIVDPSYLRKTIPYFQNPRLGFLQTRPGFRSEEPERFQRACRIIQQAFYQIIMPSRETGQSVMFGGSMGIIRREAISRCGGWDPECISEDAELSLRLLMGGYQGKYLDQEFGWGLLPVDLSGLKRQRRRWTIGGIQAFQKHAPFLFKNGPHPALPWIGWQRFHHLSAFLQWFSALCILGFTFSILSIYVFTQLEIFQLPPMILDPLFILALFLVIVFWRIRFLWAIQVRQKVSLREATEAVLLLQALTITQALACIQGLIFKRQIFERTNKFKARIQLKQAIDQAVEELSLGFVCILLGISAVFVYSGLLEKVILSFFLIWLSWPYLSVIPILVWNSSKE